MAKHWFEEAFGAALDAAARGLNEIRHSLGDEAITRGWFNRNPTAGGHDNDLGWTLVRDDAEIEPDDRKGLLDRLYETNPEHFAPEPEQPGHDPDRGIDF